MLLKLRPDSDVPIYLQIREQIVRGVAEGHLEEGKHLPSVRQLAADLGVNFHTVNKAYLLLQSEGFVKISGRRGASITAPPEYDAAFVSTLSTEIETLLTECKSRGVPKKVLEDLFENLMENYL